MKAGARGRLDCRKHHGALFHASAIFPHAIRRTDTNPITGIAIVDDIVKGREEVLQRRGEVEASEAALTNIDVEAVGDVQTAGSLAQMLIRAGKAQDALEVAYRLPNRGKFSELTPRRS
jgi:hypothetical protein